jgi:hypothetical protein
LEGGQGGLTFTLAARLFFATRRYDIFGIHFSTSRSLYALVFSKITKSRPIRHRTRPGFWLLASGFWLLAAGCWLQKSL